MGVVWKKKRVQNVVAWIGLVVLHFFSVHRYEAEISRKDRR